MVLQVFMLMLTVQYVDCFSFSGIRAPSISQIPFNNNKMENKVALMDTQVSDVKDNVVEVKSQMEGLKQKIEKLEELKKDDKKTISSLEKHVEKVEESVEKTLSKLNTTLITIENEVKSIGGNKDSNQDHNDQMKEEEEVCSPLLEANTICSGKDSSQGEKDQLKGARSCLEAQKCGKVDNDGEYYLYPSALKGQMVKIYCARMDTKHPKEYISLPNLNYGHFPQKCNHHCKGETTKGCPKKVYKEAGYVKYTKIRIDIETMVVSKGDRTFTEGNGTRLAYGEAGDCYNTIWGAPKPPDMSCGPKGEFLIDLSGTGFRFDKRTSWDKYGWKAYYDFTWSDDQKTILGVCGGWCGQCMSKKIYLELDSEDKVMDPEATEIRCS